MSGALCAKASPAAGCNGAGQASPWRMRSSPIQKSAAGFFPNTSGWQRWSSLTRVSCVEASQGAHPGNQSDNHASMRPSSMALIRLNSTGLSWICSGVMRCRRVSVECAHSCSMMAERNSGLRPSRSRSSTLIVPWRMLIDQPEPGRPTRTVTSARNAARRARLSNPARTSSRSCASSPFMPRPSRGG